MKRKSRMTETLLRGERNRLSSSLSVQMTPAHTWSSTTWYQSADALQEHIASRHTCSTKWLAFNKSERDPFIPLQKSSSLILPQGVHWGFTGKSQRQQKFDVTSGEFTLRLSSVLGEVISQAKRPLSGRNIVVIADSLPYNGWKSSEITRIMNKQSVYSGVCYYCPTNWVSQSLLGFPKLQHCSQRVQETKAGDIITHNKHSDGNWWPFWKLWQDFCFIFSLPMIPWAGWTWEVFEQRADLSLNPNSTNS